MTMTALKKPKKTSKICKDWDKVVKNGKFKQWLNLILSASYNSFRNAQFHNKTLFIIYSIKFCVIKAQALLENLKYC